MGKIIALDFGLKRTGIAISDESKTFAFGLKTVESNLLEKILQELVLKEKIDTIVLGEPKRLNTEDTHISENVRMLYDHLTKKYSELKVVLHDERFTSKMASSAIALSGLNKKKKQEKNLIDEISATILLQSYLAYSD